MSIGSVQSVPIAQSWTGFTDNTQFDNVSNWNPNGPPADNDLKLNFEPNPTFVINTPIFSFNAHSILVYPPISVVQQGDFSVDTFLTNNGTWTSATGNIDGVDVSNSFNMNIGAGITTTRLYNYNGGSLKFRSASATDVYNYGDIDCGAKLEVKGHIVSSGKMYFDKGSLFLVSGSVGSSFTDYAKVGLNATMTVIKGHTINCKDNARIVSVDGSFELRQITTLNMEGASSISMGGTTTTFENSVLNLKNSACLYTLSQSVDIKNTTITLNDNANFTLRGQVNAAVTQGSFNLKDSSLFDVYSASVMTFADSLSSFNLSQTSKLSLNASSCIACTFQLYDDSRIVISESSHLTSNKSSILNGGSMIQASSNSTINVYTDWSMRDSSQIQVSGSMLTVSGSLWTNGDSKLTIHDGSKLKIDGQLTLQSGVFSIANSSMVISTDATIRITNQTIIDNNVSLENNGTILLQANIKVEDTHSGPTQYSSFINSGRISGNGTIPMNVLNTVLQLTLLSWTDHSSLNITKNITKAGTINIKVNSLMMDISKGNSSVTLVTFGASAGGQFDSVNFVYFNAQTGTVVPKPTCQFTHNTTETGSITIFQECMAPSTTTTGASTTTMSTTTSTTSTTDGTPEPTPAPPGKKGLGPGVTAAIVVGVLVAVVVGAVIASIVIWKKRFPGTSSSIEMH
ncbi:hypothetical protein SAMD00019534_005240 [Acytostelium subglobosum LB1]|uniref:hypothetical protein n=1 Tax=Acytostelium subglobosum LB1 TaxID=1410327 RepID=UPI000644901F|nr:hypothetical protein SAMD00019534_005240 [Acytostelium subglobosum LB1]GAM17349.1 hypothetical protein SAMD00019534_005240 [Acytostelium subglobosum LB1]|eukprot:XP_012759411.1 hypothetical protein SAMD00019534_005240 [Acytostelium subglobosum LB1]